MSNLLYEKLESVLQSDVAEGWHSLKNSERYQHYKDFAHFLENQEEFQRIHRTRIPHPPHELATRDMGLSFMKRVHELGLSMSHWFPGDFYNSLEVEETEKYSDKEEIHIRSFSLTLFHTKAQDKLCDLTLSFPHTHNGFDFKEPIVKITKIHEKYPEKYITI